MCPSPIPVPVSNSITLFNNYIFFWTGVRLTTNVISSHNVESSIDCSHRCLQETTCVAFNYRSARENNKLNCQLTNNTVGVKESDVNNNNDGDWTFYKVSDVPSVN